MFEYSAYASMTSWTNVYAEKQNSRRVPSPGKATSADLTWPSLYGNPLLVGEYNKEAFLGQYIHRIYCRECREQERMAAANQSNSSNPDSPQYQMDQMSLAAAMDTNKEALSRKLLVRRSVNELVDQGIYPSLKTPAAFAVERRHLQIAQTGDKLKHKIQTRPDRQFLVQHHILEDSNVDPSLQSTQRKLKKAKLTDELNEKLANRPGPLELVEQSILQVEEPIKDAIKEGKLEFHKTQEGTEPLTISKLPYEIESPKSGTSSPEPLDCDNDSNTSSATSTGFSHVPSPPDIAPLLKHTNHITIGGQTLEIPITSHSFTNTINQVTVTTQQQHYTSNILNQRPSGFVARNRKLCKSRPKQHAKQRIIKFHEYKGPSISKSNSSSYSASGGNFITTTGPLQKLDGLTPYQLRVHQQQLYLQCQLEVQHKDSIPTVLVPIQPPATPAALTDRSEMSPPFRPVEVPRSRPVTPAMKSPPPPITAPHTPLQLSRSLSNLEDMKVAHLKQELKQRNLPVSGSKTQLIERLRAHQLQEMSTNVPSVGSYSDISSYSNLPSVQSFSDESFMAPASVASTSGHFNSAPTSPREDQIRQPSSVILQHDMETDENSQGIRSTADIVREQARRIEELQRALQQSQQQLQLVQQPYVMGPTAVTTAAVTASPTMRQTIASQQSPVDITDKQVYLATPDGKMTAYKVVLHTGANIMQNMSPSQQVQVSPSSVAPIPSPEQVVLSPRSVITDDTSSCNNALQSKMTPVENGDAHIDVEDVLEVLMRTGEIEPSHNMLAQKSETQHNFQNNYIMTNQSTNAETNTNQMNELPIEDPLSPLGDMDWIDNGVHNNGDNSVSFEDDNCNLDWLSDVMQLDSQPPMISSNCSTSINNTPVYTSTNYSTTDPVLTQKPYDVLSIFNIEDNDFRPNTDNSSVINWDRLIGQSSHHNI